MISHLYSQVKEKFEKLPTEVPRFRRIHSSKNVRTNSHRVSVFVHVVSCYLRTEELVQVSSELVKETRSETSMREA